MSDNDRPGTDWSAKHAAAGSKAQPANDRPYSGWQDSASAVSESDVTTNPGNKVDES